MNIIIEYKLKDRIEKARVLKKSMIVRIWQGYFPWQPFTI